MPQPQLLDRVRVARRTRIATLTVTFARAVRLPTTIGCAPRRGAVFAVVLNVALALTQPFEQPAGRE